MPIRLKRRIASLLLAVLAFTQVNVAFAGCMMDDGTMSSAMAGTADPCDGCDTPMDKSQGQISSLCATHCAVVDQPAATPAALTIPALKTPAFLVRRAIVDSRSTGLDGPPSGAPPRRILLHSFLI